MTFTWKGGHVTGDHLYKQPYLDVESSRLRGEHLKVPDWTRDPLDLSYRNEMVSRRPASRLQCMQLIAWVW